MEQIVFCQSCGMPLKQGLFGTEANGGLSGEYCMYCYKDGHFTYSCTMEQMIETCIPHMLEANPGMTEEQAKTMMEGFLPNLKRWTK